jgi:cytochrome P450
MIAQSEIDRIIGKDRLPTLADRDALPYMEAVYKELLRWQPLGPIGIPHRLGSKADDEYKGKFGYARLCIRLIALTGMRIPANSMVIANIGNMLHDPAVHKNPTCFEPSRFLGPNPESNPEEVVFGFGRR